MTKAASENIEDDRLVRDLGVARRPREKGDRAVTENREATDEERLELFRQQLFSNVLPDLPDIPGWHVCWLTTTNPRDTIPARMRLGYEPVTEADIPGGSFPSLKTGEYAGMIGINEMVAFKLPMRLYQSYMAEAHYHAPNREEQALAETADRIRAEAEASGGRLIEGDGMEELRYAPPRLEAYDD